jgi:hypothetical protein
MRLRFLFVKKSKNYCLFYYNSFLLFRIFNVEIYGYRS